MGKAMKVMLATFVMAVMAGCGSVCDGAVAAERGANQKGSGCGAQNITVHDAAKCNANVGKCSTDDLDQLSNYASCLNALPTCTSSNSVQFQISRGACWLQAASSISPTCSLSIL